MIWRSLLSGYQFWNFMTKILGIRILLNKESKLHDIFSFQQHYCPNVTPERIKKKKAPFLGLKAEGGRRNSYINYVYLFSFFFFLFPSRQLNQQGSASCLQLMSVHRWHKKFWAVCSRLTRLQQWCVWWGIRFLLLMTVCSLSCPFDKKSSEAG